MTATPAPAHHTLPDEALPLGSGRLTANGVFWAVLFAVILAIPTGLFAQSLIHKARVEHCVNATSTGIADIAYCDATN